MIIRTRYSDMFLTHGAEETIKPSYLSEKLNLKAWHCTSNPDRNYGDWTPRHVR